MRLRRVAELVRVTRGVWRTADSVEQLRDRCAAVLAILPAGAAFCGLTAARLHRLWVPRSAETRIEVVLPHKVPSALAHTERPEIITRRRALAAGAFSLADGLPVTTEVQTWVDLGSCLSVEDLVACGDGVVRGGANRRDLIAAIGAARGQRGVRRVRHAVELLDGRSRSRPESLLRVALVLGGLPTPAVNQAIHTDHGEWLAEPDLHYERPRLALEYQGEEHAEKTRMRKDITRTISVIGEGWLSVPFGPAEVFGRPWTIAPFVRGLAEQRAPEWLREWRLSRRVAGYESPLEG